MFTPVVGTPEPAPSGLTIVTSAPGTSALTDEKTRSRSVAVTVATREVVAHRSAPSPVDVAASRGQLAGSRRRPAYRSRAQTATPMGSRRSGWANLDATDAHLDPRCPWSRLRSPAHQRGGRLGETWRREHGGIRRLGRLDIQRDRAPRSAVRSCVRISIRRGSCSVATGVVVSRTRRSTWISRSSLSAGPELTVTPLSGASAG